MNRNSRIKKQLNDIFRSNYKPNMSYENAETLIRFMNQIEVVLRSRLTEDEKKKELERMATVKLFE